MRGKFLGTRGSAGGGFLSAWERRHLRAFPLAGGERASLDLSVAAAKESPARPVSCLAERGVGSARKMGCSTSAQTRVKDCSRPAPKSPDANGLQKRDDSVPIAGENETIPDQTKLGVMEKVELGSHGAKLNKDLAKEEEDALIPGITNCALSTCQRVDPEGTEPQPVAPEDNFNSVALPTGLLEAGEPLPVKPSEEVGEPQAASEAASPLLPETVQDNKPEPVESTETSTPEPAAEENSSLVTEIVKELQVGEEEQLTEGETREKKEIEMHSDIASEGSETKEEEMGEATVTTEIEATNNEE
ncbi:glutamate-rich protein 5 [Rhineura floridana]|uniref:glutamate-rich protein 5 n=1 Tax=Rhineura floridana TaxID=261503 RepID=UPI002AC7FF19|nr:glutamate-rich protein 5 [Rhineura floridana]